MSKDAKEKPLRWAKFRSSTFGAPKSFELRRDGIVYAKVQEIEGGWFAYGMREVTFNTSHTPATLEAAKQYAASRIRAALSAGGGNG